MSRKNKFLFYVKYTLLFALCAGLIVFFYYSNGKTMIDHGGDGFRQHFKALLYYSRYLKAAFGNLMHGKLLLPQWDFVIGEGADILKTFHYYSIGDPFTFFSFLCPEEYMYLYYDFATLARMYVCGIGFSLLAFYKEKKNETGILIGTLLYAFCAYCLTGMSGHVFFISAAAFLPFIILGAEKIICGDKPYLFAISVALSALSNIYFFYMNVVSTILFVLIRLLTSEDGWLYKLKAFAMIGAFSALGVLMSAIITLPMLDTMLHSNRLDSSVTIDFFFSLKEYLNMIKKMTFGAVYYGGFSLLWPMGITCLLLKKRKAVLIVLLVCAMLFVHLPYLSMVYNAFTYPIDRWCYAVSLLFCYIICDSLEEIEDLNGCFPVNIILVVFYYGLCMYIDQAYWQLHALFLAASLALIGFVRFVKDQKWRNLACLAVVVFGLLFQGYYEYGPNYWGFYKYGTDIQSIKDMANDEHFIFDAMEDDSFYRYSGNKLTVNQNILGEKSSTQYYWSIANDYVVDFRKQLGYSDSSNHHFGHYALRFGQNALSGVKYYINAKGDSDIPYGFTFKDSYGEYDVYESDYALPLVFAYDNYVTRQEWDQFDPAKKNEVLLHAGLVDEKLNLLEQKHLSLDRIYLLYDESHSDGLSLKRNQISASGDNAEIYLKLNHTGEGEYYVQFEGLYSQKLVSYIKVRYNGIERSVTFKGNDNQHYTDRHEYLVNLGYLDGINGTITINFSDGSNYTYKNISLIYQPLQKQISQIDVLRQIEVYDLKAENDKVVCDVKIDDDKLVCLTVPYSKGWKAKVDGKDAVLLNCDLQYMALEMPKGRHHIELSYSTPYLKAGAVVSLCAFIVWAGLMVFDGKKRKVK